MIYTLVLISFLQGGAPSVPLDFATAEQCETARMVVEERVRRAQHQRGADLVIGVCVERQALR